MLGLFGLFENPKWAARRAAEAKTRNQQRAAKAVPWGPDTKWAPELNIQASTYNTLQLFDVAPNKRMPPKPESGVLSPCGKWLYSNNVFPAASPLAIYQGGRKGTVVFDGPVVLPALYETKRLGVSYDREPWMSLTPMEIMTMRPGTRMARGDVVIAGLGLGHQLIEVSRRKQVKRLRLVEHDASLIDWLMPRIEPHLGRKVEVIVGDAYVKLPKLTADVALVDIFPNYGNNDYDASQLRRSCKSIPKIWCWGAARA
jgi:hypothetical protein